MEKIEVELEVTRWVDGEGKILFKKVVSDINGLLELKQKIHQLIKTTFVNEFCTGCSIPSSYPDGKCRGCKALKAYGLTLEEVQSIGGDKR